MAIVAFLVNHFVFAEKSDREVAIETAVTEINKKKGSMIDDITKLKGAYESSGGLVIAYQAVDLKTPFGISDDDIRLVKQTLKGRSCSNKAIREMLDLDIQVSLQFFGPTAKKKFFQVTLDKGTCH